MKKEKKLVSIIVILALVIQILLPMATYANNDVTLDIDLENDKTNKKINISVTDTTYNITELKYVNKYISIDEISYFSETHDDIVSFEITAAKQISKSFSYTQHGTYTVYAKNSVGNAMLSRITLSDPEAVPQITITKDKTNKKNITITITSKTALTTLKIAPETSLGQITDFTSVGTDIPFQADKTKENTYTATYTAQEEGLYAIYAKNAGNYSKISEPYLGTLITVTPTNLDSSLKINDGSGKVKFTVTDKLWNITEVRIAKETDLTSPEDVATQGTPLEITTPAKTLNLEYPITEDANYIFYIKDEENRGLYYTTRILVTDVEPASINIVQDTQNKKSITITATDNVADITEMKIATGSNLTMDYVIQNGTSITITPGKTVTTNYQVEENCTLAVYIKDADGYGYFKSQTITGIDDPVVDPVTLQLTQDDQTSGEVTIVATSITSNIKKIKYSKGSKDKAYFAENGTNIEITTLGRIVRTSFTAEESGVYTVYTIDADGNELAQEITVTIAPAITLGDVNEDDKINIRDIIKIRKYIANSTKWDLSDKQKTNADVDRNSRINIRDIIKIRKYIAANSSESIRTKHPEWLEF